MCVVIAGLDPAIHLLRKAVFSRWMPGSRLRQGYAGPIAHSAAEALAKAASPGMTTWRHMLKSFSTPLATSLFQMNSTTSAPIVEVMKPAPWSGL